MLIDQKAPAFKATACMADNSFQDVSLEDYKGKYVFLFFYPADFTFVCASEVPGFEKMAKDFEAKNCAIIGVSTDSQHSHKAWKVLSTDLGGIGALSYPLVADKDFKISKDYDVLLPNGECTRGLFLIDKEGVVKAEHRNCDPLGRNLEEAMRLLDALQFHEDCVAKGEKMVCPVNWKKGKKAIKPTLEGVGDFNKAGGVDQLLAA